MHFKEVKGILSSKNRMNLFRGCTNGCIYSEGALMGVFIATQEATATG